MLEVTATHDEVDPFVSIKQTITNCPVRLVLISTLNYAEKTRTLETFKHHPRFTQWPFLNLSALSTI